MYEHYTFFEPFAYTKYYDIVIQYMMGAVRLVRACCGQHQVAARKPFHVAAQRGVGTGRRCLSTHGQVE